MTLRKTQVEDVKDSVIVMYRRTHYRIFPFETAAIRLTIHGNDEMTLWKTQVEDIKDTIYTWQCQEDAADELGIPSGLLRKKAC